MDIISALLLLLSTTLSSTRNVLTKSFTGFSIKNREFFRLQAIIFGIGSIVLSVVLAFDYNGISPITVLYALIYGFILLCAQWFYTIALSNGKTAICATIYSFGFVIPTLSGTLFWNEKISVFGYIGILTVIPVLIISSIGSKKNENTENKSKKYIIPLVIALISSGGLGVMQKLQQKSEYANQTSAFILIAFVFAFLTSILLGLFMKKGEKMPQKHNYLFCSLVGAIFATCNLLNTILAGRLDSAVLFPILNVGIIILSVLFGFIFYKEKLTKKDVWVMLLGVLAIVLVNL